MKAPTPQISPKHCKECGMLIGSQWCERLHMTKDTKYTIARAEAQRLANESARANPDYAKRGGCDWGLKWNSVFNEYSFRRLPLPQFRFGHELSCEVVMPEINRF